MAWRDTGTYGLAGHECTCPDGSRTWSLKTLLSNRYAPLLFHMQLVLYMARGD